MRFLASAALAAHALMLFAGTPEALAGAGSKPALVAATILSQKGSTPVWETVAAEPGTLLGESKFLEREVRCAHRLQLALQMVLHLNRDVTIHQIRSRKSPDDPTLDEIAVHFVSPLGVIVIRRYVFSQEDEEDTLTDEQGNVYLLNS